ncbi:MAG: hybrid sensor histidine kinase/response regulator [Flavobacterium sp.]|nr:hybrid sensor histidine kinase/response regulator [Flavobacterium sp.]
MSKKILVLEDDFNILNNVVELLESEKYEVCSVSNGREGLDILKSYKPDIILCDIMMPHINGIEFYKQVKTNYDTKLIPFIFLTAKTDLTSIREGLSLGADDYITKPFLAEDLLKTIQIRLTRQSEFNDQFESLVKNINMYIPHEMRTPLVAIIGFSRLILADLATIEKSEIKEMTERILWSAHRLNNRIEKFISYSDLNLSINNSFNDPNSRISNFNDDLFSKMISGHYSICDRISSIKLSFEPVSLRISEWHLERLLREVVENAVKFSANNSEIIVNGAVKGQDYFITIKDSGIGLNNEEIEKIGIFQQFSREVYSQDGNGLGLAIAKRIVDMNNGEIVIESKKNNYTIVKIKLPICMDE